MNILIFPASVRKIWINDFKRIRNPGYCLFGWLVKRLSCTSHRIFVAGNSVEIIKGISPWRGEGIDMILILGADYTPYNTKISYKNGIPTNGPFAKSRPSSSQIYAIRNDLNKLPTKPFIYFLSVDVRGWEKNAEKVLGVVPNDIVTEQEMHWQEIGYVVTKRLRDKLQGVPKYGFGFHGHMKNRQQKGVDYFNTIPVPLTIDGMGWSPTLFTNQNITCRGQKTFIESVMMMNSKRYSITMHEPEGNEQGWITTRYFENLALDVVNFVDREYDKRERVIAHNDFRRVTSPHDLREKILFLEKDPNEVRSIINKQQAEVDPLWMDFNTFFYIPFKKRIGL